MAVHRGKSNHEWTEVDDVPFDGGPRLTGLRGNGDEWSDRVRQKWQTWRRMPHCILWTDSDWEYAFDTLELVARFHSGGRTGGTGTAQEIRQREAQMGTTVDSRRALRIRYVDPKKPAPLAVVKNADDYRDL
ncbi:hypothetical protein B5P44_15680 [Mycobacterium sp. CBMA 213]|nr:hypothetical protein [Mycolicibacterium sp. CBMA 213]